MENINLQIQNIINQSNTKTPNVGIPMPNFGINNDNIMFQIPNVNMMNNIMMENINNKKKLM